MIEIDGTQVTVSVINGKPALVDVPVKINIWVRPVCQRTQFEVIKQARPSVIFLISDGGRNSKEWEAIHNNRKIYENEVDWDCTIYKLYEKKNNGLYTMINKYHKLIWAVVDRCVFLEDDHIPSVSFFSFCADLLDRYKYDLRVLAICGMNHLGVYDNVNSDYFFSFTGSIWGMAMWKRTVDSFDRTFEYYKDLYIIQQLKYHTRQRKHKCFLKQLLGYPLNEKYGGHIPGSEFFLAQTSYCQNQLLIVPKRNMICCMGATADSAHASELKYIPSKSRRIFNMHTYEVNYPIRHATNIIPDYIYSNLVKRHVGQSPWYNKILTGLEIIWLNAKYQNFNKIFLMLKRKLGYNKKEN